MDFTYIIRQLIISAPPILIAIILHEVAHGFIAHKLGDPTAKLMGRLTLNPLAHVDPFGTILMPLLLFAVTNGQFVFGYAKPVPINPMNFKNPRKDMAIAAISGPVTNLFLSVASAVLLKHVLYPLSFLLPGGAASAVIQPLALMLKASVIVNVILAVFNMLPVPPLDGGRVLMGILPKNQAAILGKIEPFGFLIVILLVVTGISSYIIWPFIVLLLRLVESV